ncbi:sigma-70 family RNA polymerase sigma factor [Sorangium sp. So ce233]|uniref:sigma-70 family RNA polymerase sigma factor n=1 Tax=Sorangium sp. So ce233 TaxID=3133290 RepID=UPI003F5F4A66
MQVRLADIVRHIRMIVDVLRQFKVPASDRPDVMQDILLSAWRTVETGGFRPSDRLSKRQAMRRWLYTVAWHHIIHYRERELRWEKGRASYVHPAIDGYVPPPFEQIEARLSLGCLERLKPALRDVVMDAAFGYTAEEIAAELGQNPITIQHRVERGREQFRRALRVKDAPTPLAIKSMLASMPSLAPLKSSG